MNQNIWGPATWTFLHTVSFNYPIKPKQCDVDAYIAFFQSLRNIIPCSVCRGNYNRHLREYPIQLQDRKSLVKWLIDLHNQVNLETGKRPLSYDEVITQYEEKYGKDFMIEPSNLTNDCLPTKYVFLPLIIIAFIYVGYYVYK